MQGTSINFQRFLVGAWEFPTYNYKETDQGGPLVGTYTTASNQVRGPLAHRMSLSGSENHC